MSAPALRSSRAFIDKPRPDEGPLSRDQPSDSALHLSFPGIGASAYAVSRRISYNRLSLEVPPNAKVAKLADAPDLGSGGVTRGGSSPPFRTNILGPIEKSALFHCAYYCAHALVRKLISGRRQSASVCISCPTEGRSIVSAWGGHIAA